MNPLGASWGFLETAGRLLGACWGSWGPWGTFGRPLGGLSEACWRPRRGLLGASSWFLEPLGIFVGGGFEPPGGPLGSDIETSGAHWRRESGKGEIIDFH